MSTDKKFSTKVISTPFAQKDSYGAINMPVYRNAAFEFASSEEIAAAFQNQVQAHTYSRISNPTVTNLEQKIQAASGAQNVMALASGMAAISNVFLTIAYAGCNIVTSPHLFGNTFSLFKFTLAEFGIEVRFVDTDNLKEVEEAIDENTCAFFCELITNPHLEIADLFEISKITRSKKIPFILDSTIVPWCCFNARNAGVDIEVVSTTKYISGGATSIGGAILDYGTFDWSANKKLKTISSSDNVSSFTFKLRREIARNIGASMSPETASLQSLGMETLELRFEHMSKSTFELAQFLSEQNRVVKVNYPGIKSSVYFERTKKLFSSYPGAMLTFNLKTKEECYNFMDRLQIIRRATNLFDNKTLIIHPESTIYGIFSKEMKEFMDIDDTQMRLSVGLESVEDLKEDIIQALELI